MRLRFSKEKTKLIIFFALILFIIANINPKLGIDIYLIIRWLLLLSIPIILIYEFLIIKRREE
jgi:hypothetical protein